MLIFPSRRGDISQQQVGARYLHVTLKFVEVVVGFLTHDGVVETLRFELYLLRERGCREVIKAGLAFIDSAGSSTLLGPLHTRAPCFPLEEKVKSSLRRTKYKRCPCNLEDHTPWSGLGLSLDQFLQQNFVP